MGIEVKIGIVRRWYQPVASLRALNLRIFAVERPLWPRLGLHPGRSGLAVGSAMSPWRLCWLLALVLCVIPPPAVAPSWAVGAQALLADSSARASLESFPAEERGAINATLALLEAGGPFPYRQDGAIFSNREGLLPAEPRAYYHEYTVPTLGAHDRGARRIVTGRRGEVYYTDDHYRSFWRIR